MGLPSNPYGNQSSGFTNALAAMGISLSGTTLTIAAGTAGDLILNAGAGGTGVAGGDIVVTAGTGHAAAGDGAALTLQGGSAAGVDGKVAIVSSGSDGANAEVLTSDGALATWA